MQAKQVRKARIQENQIKQENKYGNQKENKRKTTKTTPTHMLNSAWAYSHEAVFLMHPLMH